VGALRGARHRCVAVAVACSRTCSSRASSRSPTLLRLVVGAVFFESGRRHAADPVKRGADIGVSPAVARALGIAEMAGAAGVAFGVLTQLAALGLILVMLGAIQEKVLVWHTGFWGDRTYGWHYDLLFVATNLVIMTTGGGRFVVL